MKDISVISQLVENDAVFKCKGYSDVKVSRRKDEGVETEIIRIPIHTAGVLEHQEHISKEAPKPPVIQKTVKAGTDEAAELGIDEDALKMVFDTTDEAYVTAYNEHFKDYVYRTAVFAMDIEWEKADGSPAESFEEKKKILFSCGISGPQLDQIYGDIINLSRFQAGRIDFLSGKPSGTMTG